MRTQAGLNVIIDGGRGGCRVQELDGRDVDILPGGFCLFLPEGQYFSILEGPTLYDEKFQILWSRTDILQHHEAVYDADRGVIWLIANHFEGIGDELTAFDEVLGLERKTGKTLWRWRTKENLNRLSQLSGDGVRRYVEKGTDYWQYTHFNTISVVPKSSVGPGRPGDLLLTNTGTFEGLYFLTPETGEIRCVWKLFESKNRSVVHHAAQYFASGEILLFLNSVGADHSEIALINAIDGSREWTFRAPDGRAFHSSYFGAVQPLKNGNFLVTHMTKFGEAFEVTRDGRIVWDWRYFGARAGDRLATYRV